MTGLEKIREPPLVVVFADLRGLFEGESDEMAEFHQLGLGGIQRGESFGGIDKTIGS